MKKDELVAKTAILEDKIKRLESQDENRRCELTNILLYRDPADRPYSDPFTRKVDNVLTWLQIAFHMGELRADANYNMLQEANRIKDNEIAELKNRIKELESKAF